MVKEPSLLSTMLGSCVGVALWDRQTGVAGLNHYLLPEPIDADHMSTRYGTVAMQKLIEQVLRAGANKKTLVARVFGGAAVLGDVSIGQRIGEKNIETALEFLAKQGIRILEKNLGGNRGRRLNFNTATGAVTVAFSNSTAALAEQEPRVKSRPHHGPAAGIFVVGNTGAAKSVARMLTHVPSDAPPIVIAVPSFGSSLPKFVEELQKRVKLHLKIVSGYTHIASGTAYFIREGQNVKLRSASGMLSVDVTVAAGTGLAPSADLLLDSVAETLGAGAVGVVLSGYGTDGQKGLYHLHRSGGIAFAESPKEAGSPQAPKAVIEQGIAMETTMENIYHTIQSYCGRRSA